MGCDIHTICEVKENGVWRKNTDKVFPNPYYNPKRRKEEIERYRISLESGDITQEQFDSWSTDDWSNSTEKLVLEPNSSRDYDWFAILADVRNGRGFAGWSTGSGFNIISDPKGLPEDISTEALKMFCDPISDDPKLQDEEDENGNHHVSTKNAAKWVESGYSKFVTIDGVQWVTNPDYHSDSYFSVEDFDAFNWRQHVGSDYGERVTYTSFFKRKRSAVITPLRKLAKKYEDARMVFAFDN